MLCVVAHQEHHTNQTGLYGSYLWAFCSGLNSMLQPYRKALLDVEQEVNGTSDIEHFACCYSMLTSGYCVIGSSSLETDT